MTINEYIRTAQAEHASEFLRIIPRVECNDGFTLSVQVGDGHYCTPRVMNAQHYDQVEVGYPSEEEPLLISWAERPDEPTESVYGYVPCDIVDVIIEKHGGIKEVKA